VPSQIAHTLCAEETYRSVVSPSSPPDHEAKRARAISHDPTTVAHLALGAQGPDLFYHNQRRRPTGIQYGTLLHRRGYGSVTAGLVSAAIQRNAPPSSAIGAYIVAFLTHAVLDRHLHPYINYKAGRPVQGDPSTERFRTMHAFLERLIDIALLQELRGETAREYSFFGKIEPMVTTEPDGIGWVNLIQGALIGAFDRAANDTKLTTRLQNAWLDAVGYYRFTDNVTPAYLTEALQREENSEVRRTWLSIIHPPNVPTDLDVLNLGHAEWTHPCSSRRRSTASVLEMYRAAVDESISIVKEVVAVWNGALSAGEYTAEAAMAIAETVGDYNLSDGRPRKRPCRPRHMDPFPLAELQEEIRASIKRGDGGIV
jgi:hypothetical protein